MGPDAAAHLFTCPTCASALAKTESGFACTDCGLEYRRTAWGGIDLRPQKPKTVDLRFVIDQALPKGEGLDFNPLKPKPATRDSISAGEGVPYHFSSELLSYFPRAGGPGQRVLDLGCGNGVHRKLCESAGYQWYGVDADPDEKPPIFGDAHALPFADNSFDVVISMSVLEHIRYPHVALNEVQRVLKPGGKFIGSVAFMEPFHGNSYYHCSHLGTLSALQHAKFKVEAIAPNTDWLGLEAIGNLALFPRVPPRLIKFLFVPVLLLHRLYWFARRFVKPDTDPYLVVRRITGSFAFVATRP
ncbi:MAG TPA: class I SAM-dependent methyltransferase [Burkholderiaceae bacterium]|nr:class I SAM-dependent methyltransferase [Burkholderiaceae bacterium]